MKRLRIKDLVYEEGMTRKELKLFVNVLKDIVGTGNAELKVDIQQRTIEVVGQDVTYIWE